MLLGWILLILGIVIFIFVLNSSSPRAREMEKLESFYNDQIPGLPGRAHWRARIETSDMEESEEQKGYENAVRIFLLISLSLALVGIVLLIWGWIN